MGLVMLYIMCLSSIYKHKQTEVSEGFQSQMYSLHCTTVICKPKHISLKAVITNFTPDIKDNLSDTMSKT